MFTRHAVHRAKQRFAGLRGFAEDDVTAALADALLGGEVVYEEPGGVLVRRAGRRHEWVKSPDGGAVTIRGSLMQRPVEFIVDPASGSVLTVIDPDERAGDERWFG